MQDQVRSNLPGVLYEQRQFVGAERLDSEVFGRHAGYGGGLHIQQHRSRDRRALRADSVRAARSVRTGNIPVPLLDEPDEPVHRIEKVPSVREPDELLRYAGVVVLGSGFEEMVPRQKGNIVDELQPVVLAGVDRQEVRQAYSESVGEIHADVGKGPPADAVELRGGRRFGAGQNGSPVASRTMLHGPLAPEFVERRIAPARIASSY